MLRTLCELRRNLGWSDAVSHMVGQAAETQRRVAFGESSDQLSIALLREEAADCGKLLNFFGQHKTTIDGQPQEQKCRHKDFYVKGRTRETMQGTDLQYAHRHLRQRSPLAVHGARYVSCVLRTRHTFMWATG